MLNLNSDINVFALSQRIKRPLIIDGAMGSLLQQKGIPVDSNLWMSLANQTHPEILLEIHNDYIKAGADIITTNTFRTNPVAIKESDNINSAEKLVKPAVEIAKQAIGDLPVLIAGSNAPAEDCYKVERVLSNRELELNHKRHINLLYENGAHFILNETQSHFDEIKIISEYCDRNEIPYVMNIFFNDDLEILSGEILNEVLAFLKDSDALAIGFNCILPSTMARAKRRVKMPENWGLYLNCGDGSFTDSGIKCGISPSVYAEEISNYLKNRPSFIGACCGSSTGHIRSIKKLLDERNS
jgi:methionine synthase I (cobalamin-dependent)